MQRSRKETAMQQTPTRSRSWRDDPASDGQLGLLGQLRTERVIPPEADSRLQNRLAARDFTKGEAHDAIDWIVEHCAKVQLVESTGQPDLDAELEQATEGTVRAVVSEPGVFETPDGTIYVVKPNRAKTRLYAKRLVELTPSQGDRLNLDDQHVRFEFQYAPGAMATIREEHRMPLTRAKELALRYGRCVNCGRKLKVAESVERGMGPVCVKRFKGWSE